MLKDDVKCNNCEWNGTVECGENTCPICGMVGTLKFTNIDIPEVEE